MISRSVDQRLTHLATKASRIEEIKNFGVFVPYGLQNTLILRVVGFEELLGGKEKVHNFKIGGIRKCYKNANSPHKRKPG